MKMLKGIGKIVLYVFGSILIILVLLLLFSVKLLDRTPVQETKAYASMMNRLDTTEVSFVKPKHAFWVGYSKVNLTPDFKTATAGYGKRLGKHFDRVYDSLYVRTIVVDNGSERIAIVTADLLMIPPLVTEALEKQLPTIGFNLNNTFLGATHTHNGMGNWGQGATQILYGNFQPRVVDLITISILRSIKEASENLLPAEMRTGVIPIEEVVRNRVMPDDSTDPNLRVITFQRSDNTKLLLMNYTAHATCLFAKDLMLSRDYPGKLVDIMEKQYCNFAMFMAGAVGSHGCRTPEAGTSCIDWMAEKISEKFLRSQEAMAPVKDSTLFMNRVLLSLPDPQVKLIGEFALRPWFFNRAFGEYPVYLTNFRIGNVIMLGTPCDFSGVFDATLDSLAAKENLSVMISSFNGGYIGYVTPARYYDINHYETQLLNWFPPGNGEYISKCLQSLIVKDAEARLLPAN